MAVSFDAPGQVAALSVPIRLPCTREVAFGIGVENVGAVDPHCTGPAWGLGDFIDLLQLGVCVRPGL